ncbi:serine/arginine-rich splicing factor SR45a isoform X2 [Quercus robur]|uniref:serine/arginine-rich splicing factor SR45a isoform X2 n=1 Tax=Quercus robur TaxID=38942 RepID=UPI0021635916|nr:serine/arginine-rich splicing factor SR45a isoform X2 [Quercus robur]
MMSYSRRSRYSRSPSPYRRYRSVSRSLSRSRSTSRSRYGRSPSRDVENPGNNLYVTGLSPRVTKRELEKHFAIEGTVVDVHLVVDPWTRESRGFGFVTMATLEEADRCIKHLNNSVIEGRVITVEKARRRRGRTPTPGRYLGLRTIRVRRRTPSYSPRRSPSYSPYRRGRSRSPRYSSERSRSRSYSPYYVRQRSCSPYYSRRSYSPDYSRRSYSRCRTRSPYYSRRRSYSRSASPYSLSPVSQRDQSYSPYDSRYHYRSVSRSMSPRPRRSRRSYSHSVSPRPRRSSRRSYSRSVSPKGRTSRSYFRSVSPKPRSTKSRSHGGSSRHGYSRSYSRSPSGSVSPSSRSISRSRSASASSRSPSR